MFPVMHCKLLVHSHQNGEHVQYWGFYNYSIWNKFLNLTVSYLKLMVCKAFIEIGLYNAAKISSNKFIQRFGEIRLSVQREKYNSSGSFQVESKSRFSYCSV